MRIVFSSTSEQEQEIGNLVSFFYKSIFPKYFTEDEILQFVKIGVLQIPANSITYFGTLKDAFQVMTCLQVIISIIEKKESSKIILEEKFVTLFENNVRMLNDYGVLFPLDIHHFSNLKNEDNNGSFLLYIEAANQYLN